MPKKKQVTFQSNIPGKFIPRDDTPSATVLRPGTHDNRFNAKIAEMLASSAISAEADDECTFDSNRRDPSVENRTSSNPNEVAGLNVSGARPKVLSRRIVTLMGAMRSRGESAEPSSPLPARTFPRAEPPSHPITFGELRKATASSATPPSRSPGLVTPYKLSSARSYNDLASSDVAEHSSSAGTNNRSPFSSSTMVPTSTTSSKHQKSKEQVQRPPITVDEIIATYYSKVSLSAASEQRPLPRPSQGNANTDFYIPPPPFAMNQPNRNRPPPPSYSASIANGHRPPQTAMNLNHHLRRLPVPSSVLEQFYATSSINQQVTAANAPLLLPTSANHGTVEASARPPPPQYSVAAATTEHRPDNNPPPPTTTGFDREFSRLLYGKDESKSRHQRQKRKALSDPVKKSVEEAGRSIDKGHRRHTGHLTRTDTVREEEENGNDPNEMNKYKVNSLPHRRTQRPFDDSKDHHPAAKTTTLPANSSVKKPIPPFLRVYSQASSSTDKLLQWDTFDRRDLESFDAMMTRLYRDENFLRVQSYENYRAALVSILAQKSALSHGDTDDDGDSITTTAL